MTRVVGIARATYNFFAGDAIILTAVVVAFVLAAVLEGSSAAGNAVTAALFIACIVGGLTLTLGRELRGRKR